MNNCAITVVLWTKHYSTVVHSALAVLVRK